MTRIERALSAAIARTEAPGSPPLLVEALRYAVFPKGSRIRPKLCLAVASACGDPLPGVTDAAAAAVEFLHCASLIHDDLPCFDDADTRRGRPSVHRAFGQPLAVLAGDTLIVLAFETLAREAVAAPHLLAPLILCVGQGVGAPFGLCAGQAWESEPKIDVAAYHRAKTGALFVAAAVAGATAAGSEPAPWRAFGECLGEAYQVADDIRDAVMDPETLGKPAAQDVALGRPSAVIERGLDGAVHLVEQLVAGAIAAIPACERAGDLRALVASEAQRLLPKGLARRAA
jgi:geranylgeranyl diphosphate synthase type II